MRSHAKASSAGSTLRQAAGLGHFDRGAFAGRARSFDADGRGAPSLDIARAGRAGLVGIGLLMAFAFLAFAPTAFAAKIPGGPPLAIFGPEPGTCDATKTTTATGTGDVVEANATGKGDATTLATGTGKVTILSSGLPTRRITDLSTSLGEFEAGEEISGAFIADGTKIVAVEGSTLRIDKTPTLLGGGFEESKTTNLFSGSKMLTNVVSETGAFEVGQGITGPGIPDHTTVTAVGADTLTLSRNVTSSGTQIPLTAVSTRVLNVSTSCGAFKVGQEVSGTGLPADAAISAVGSGTFTIPKAPAIEGNGVALKATTRFGILSTASNLAVDETGRRLYAYDPLLRRISSFSLPGLTASTFLAPAGPGAINAGSASFTSPIAVDNSETASASRLYFMDADAGLVHAFQPDGTELNIGNAFPNFPIQVLGVGIGRSKICGATVDKDGNLWVGDSTKYGPNAASHYLIRKYDSSGVLVDTIEISSAGRSSCGVAVDLEDNLYVSGNIFPDQEGIWRYSADDDYAPLLADKLGVQGSSIALDKGRGLIYAMSATDFTGEKVAVRTTEEDLLGEFAEGIAGDLASIALDETGQRVYVADDASGHIYAFGFVDTPDVTTGVAVGADVTHQTLRGQVNPLSKAVEDCNFEYTLESEFAIFGWANAVSAPCAEDPGSGSSPVDVSAELGGLPPATKYRVRLTAENTNGRTIGATKTFTTKGPVVSGESVSEMTSTSARLEATINPNGEGTSYRFQYVLEADFEDSGWAKAVSVPTGVAGVGNGNVDIQVSRQITGLAPGETYRFRAVASNASATLGGRGSSLTTLLHDGTNCTNDALRSGTSAHLPECRAYEQVSPVDKGGYDIEPRWPVIASPDGENVAYASTGGFGDSKIAGYPVAYVARHGAEWNTEGISAPTDPVGGGDIFIGMVYGASEDLGIQLVGTNAELTPDAPEIGYQLYVHYSADDSYRYVATIPAPGGDFFPMSGATLSVDYAGASADGGSIFFSTRGEGHPATGQEAGFSLPSTPPPPETALRNFYEFVTVSGELKLVGVLPDDTTVEPQGSTAPHLTYPAPPISQEAVAEATVSSHPVSRDGSVYWQPAGNLGLYRRENGHSRLVGSGQFQGATPDGSFAFYGAGSLKRYDEEEDSSTDLGVGAFRVLGFSDDGEYLYFLSHGAYAPGSFPAPGNAANLFVWHEGEVRLIARLPEADDFLNQSRTVKWRVSSNGRYLGFLTGNPLAGRGFSYGRQPLNPDTDGPHQRAFLYDYLADSFTCASCPVDDESSTPESDVLLKPPPPLIGLQTFDQFHEESRNVTDTGQFFFSTPESLVPEDVNDKYDVYEYRSGGVSLISTGQSNEDSWFGDATPEGDAVFFTTREGLVEQDKDPNVDLYVARVNGGLASQRTSAQGAVCQDAEQCHGAPTTAPNAPGPGTPAFEAPPQAQPPAARRCKAGKVKRKGRCVKPRKKQRRKPAKRAGNGRRAAR